MDQRVPAVGTHACITALGRQPQPWPCVSGSRKLHAYAHATRAPYSGTYEYTAHNTAQRTAQHSTAQHTSPTTQQHSIKLPHSTVYETEVRAHVFDSTTQTL
jgi:hypothetical protein